MELVDQLRLAIPEEIRSAEEILSQKDQIIGNAETNARRTKSMAEDDYRDRLNNSELVAQAEARAQQTLRDAEERASRMLQQSEAAAQSRRTEADAYALRSLRGWKQSWVISRGPCARASKSWPGRLPPTSTHSTSTVWTRGRGGSVATQAPRRRFGWPNTRISRNTRDGRRIAGAHLFLARTPVHSPGQGNSNALLRSQSGLTRNFRPEYNFPYPTGQFRRRANV